MIYETFQLHEKYPDATLTAYVPNLYGEMKMQPRPAVIVCPGGGYHFLSEREAEPIVLQFLAANFEVFLLRYSVGAGAADYAPLEASLAMKFVRENAEKYNVDPNRVFINGYSAGGHLAASLGILHHIDEIRERVDMPQDINKPTGMILAYPVITAGPFKHKGTITNVCGSENPPPELLSRFSLELNVDSRTAPAFIWHTFTDRTVPVQNSIMLADALAGAKVPFELHIFPEGAHGLSLANEMTCSQNPGSIVPHVQCWMELAIRWINTFGA